MEFINAYFRSIFSHNIFCDVSIEFDESILNVVQLNDLFYADKQITTEKSNPMHSIYRIIQVRMQLL